jgi:hypothetical protein
MSLGTAHDGIGRHRAFLGREAVDRPLIGSWLYGFYVHEQYPSVAAAMKPGPIQPDDIPIDLFVEDVAALWRAYSDLDDDYPFSTGAFYGVPWMEAIMGCPVFFSGTNMYSRPIIADWDSFDWQRPTLDNPWAQKLLEFLDALVKRSQGQFACGPTLMRGPADMVAAMRGGTDMVLDLYDQPEKVRRLAELCADVWIEVGRAQLDLVPESENGYIAGCAGLRCWMPEKGIWLQDDTISLLSPGFYRDLFLPQIRRIAAQFPAVAFHLHGDTRWAADLLLEVDEIDVLEMNYDVGVCDLEQVIADWKKIQQKKPVIAFANVSLQEFEHILDELSPVGLSVQTLSPTLEVGRDKRDRVHRRTSTRTAR